MYRHLPSRPLTREAKGRGFRCIVSSAQSLKFLILRARRTDCQVPGSSSGGCHALVELSWAVQIDADISFMAVTLGQLGDEGNIT